MNDANRLNVIPEKKLQHKIWTCNKLAQYFGVPKAELKEDVDLREELLYSPFLADTFRLYTQFYCVHIEPKQLSLSILFNGKKITKSNLYEYFLVGEAYAASQHYALAIHITESDVYVMYRAEGYDGLGGVFVQAPDNEGFVIEPIGNYLQTHHPKDDIPL